jgi:hypothetical protein
LISRISTAPLILWPEAPKIDKSLLVPGVDPKILVPSLVIDPPQPEMPEIDFTPRDPRASLTNIKDGVNGRLVYAPYIKLPGIVESQRYFVWMGANISGSVDGRNTDVCAYHVTKHYEYIYDPLFSPDGRLLCFKYGWPYQRGSAHSFIIWDLAGKRLFDADGSAYPFVAWSPNSRYILYIKDTDPRGFSVDNAGKVPIKLFVHDVQTGTSRQVAQNVMATLIRRDARDVPDFWSTEASSWTPQNTVLFTAWPFLHKPKVAKSKSAAATKSIPTGGKPVKKEEFAYYSVYEVATAGGEPKQLITKAASPMSSPNGKWVAFWGWPEKEPEYDPKNPPARPEYARLYVWERATKQRKKLGEQTAGLLRWTPDSKQLVVLEPRKIAPNISEGHIWVYDSDTWEGRDMITIVVKDYIGLNGVPYRFNSMKISKDNTKAFVDVSEYTGYKVDTFVEKKTWQAVDLKSGKVEIIATTENQRDGTIGWDWYDESKVSPPVTVKSQVKIAP